MKRSNCPKFEFVIRNDDIGDFYFKIFETNEVMQSFLRATGDSNVLTVLKETTCALAITFWDAEVWICYELEHFSVGIIAHECFHGLMSKFEHQGKSNLFGENNVEEEFAMKLQCLIDAFYERLGEVMQ